MPIVTLLPAATFTAPCAASVITFLPAVVKLLRSWFAALSIALRVVASKPIVTFPSSPVVITIPDFVVSLSVAGGVAGVVVPPVAGVVLAAGCATVPEPATKFKPFCSFTLCAAVSATPLAR